MKRKRKTKNSQYRFTVKVEPITQRRLQLQAKSLHCTQNQLAIELLTHQLRHTSVSDTVKAREFQVLAQSLTHQISRLWSLWNSIAQQHNETTIEGKPFAGEATLARVQARLDQAIATRDQLAGVWAGKHPHPDLYDYLLSARKALPAVLNDTAESIGDTTAKDIAEYLIALKIL